MSISQFEFPDSSPSLTLNVGLVDQARYVSTHGLMIIYGIIVDIFSHLRYLKARYQGLNIVYGIFLDTFILGDLNWTSESDMRDTCFICSRNSFDFEHHGKGFSHHVRSEHNMWAYLYFFIHLNGTKVNDYTAMEMFVYRLLCNENYDFFPLDRALSLALMGKDATESKLDDLMAHVSFIVEKQRREDTEKKRQQERLKQKIWEQKHRIESFRRRAKLPGVRDDPMMSIATGQMNQSYTMAVNAFKGASDIFGGGKQPQRRESQSSQRSPKSKRSLSPIQYASDMPEGISSPSREDYDDPHVRSLSPVRYDESRSRTPMGSRQASGAETVGMSPSQSRREHLQREHSYSRDPGSLLSPGDRRSSVQHSDRRASIAPTDLLTEQLEGPAFQDDYPSRHRDMDDGSDSWHYESRL